MRLSVAVVGWIVACLFAVATAAAFMLYGKEGAQHV